MSKKNTIYLTVFISGFVLMVFEIVGSRVLAPFLGSSTVVWTSIIGVILGFMSFGYWYGGKLADKNSTLKRLATILIFTALSILIINLGKNFILSAIAKLNINLTLKSLTASIALFSIPSFFLALISPLAIRICMVKVSDSGKTAGNIYAVSTTGSILGTFFSGFIIIAFFGTNQILWGLSITLFLLAAIISYQSIKKHFIWFLILLAGNIFYSFKNHNYIDIDTNYSRVFIAKNTYNNRDVKYLYIDGHPNSRMYIDSPNELAYQYTKYYDLVEFFSENWKNTILFGGGGYSYPKHFQEKFPGKQLDIVEIDSEITNIAKEYFNFKPTTSTHIIHQDARYFLSNTTKKYDAVLYDVLTSNLFAPFHLTTKEAYIDISNIMTSNGVLIINLIGDLNGKGSKFIQSEIKTIKQVFPNIYVFNALGKDFEGISNNIIIASKNKEIINFSNADNQYTEYLDTFISPVNIDNGIIFTDNYAPANYLMSK